ncbi:RHS repeat-associated core domain-containing protein, partial [Marinilabiliaceae bacterium JC017]
EDDKKVEGNEISQSGVLSRPVTFENSNKSLNLRLRYYGGTPPSEESTLQPQLIASNTYYPFGMTITSLSTGGEMYRYGFNGKEKDDQGEWGQTAYDYGFRIYNPGIARFLSVDPLTSEYPWYTPYQFAGNNPIKFIDLDGLEEAENEVSRSRNMIVILHATELLNIDKSPKDQGSWHIVFANDFQSANNQIKSSLNGKKINNLIVRAHGMKNGGFSYNGGKVTSKNLKDYRLLVENNSVEEYKGMYFVKKEGEKYVTDEFRFNEVSAIDNLVKSIEKGGTLVVTGCQNGDYKSFIDEMNISFPDINMYFNMDNSNFGRWMTKDKNGNIILQLENTETFTDEDKMYEGWRSVDGKGNITNLKSVVGNTGNLQLNKTGEDAVVPEQKK